MQVYFNERICCLLVKGLNKFIVLRSLKELPVHDLKVPPGGIGKGCDSRGEARYLTKARQILIRNQVYFQNIMIRGTIY